MAAPRSAMILRARLSGVFHKTVPREVCTTIAACLPATRLHGGAGNKVQFLLRYSTSACKETHSRIASLALLKRSSAGGTKLQIPHADATGAL